MFIQDINNNILVYSAFFCVDTKMNLKIEINKIF